VPPRPPLQRLLRVFPRGFQMQNRFRFLTVLLLLLAGAAAVVPAQVYEEDFAGSIAPQDLTVAPYNMTIEDNSGDGLGGSSSHGLPTWFGAADGDIGPGIPFWAGTGA